MGTVHRSAGDWRWEGVPARAYESGAERHTIIGPTDGARDCELRYFRIPAGGASALESHEHEHAILIVHGRAMVRLGDRDESVGPGDAVFVASLELHQLTPIGDEDLGFLCTARANRAPGPSA
ncbi:MAG: cupin domain-containing protein [Miltoncostaeaceae bacterium]